MVIATYTYIHQLVDSLANAESLTHYRSHSGYVYYRYFFQVKSGSFINTNNQIFNDVAIYP